MGTIVEPTLDLFVVTVLLPEGFELWLVDGDGSRTLLERITL